MGVIRFFKDNITGRLALMLLLILLVLLTLVQAATQRAYQGTLQTQLVNIETRNLRMQAESLNSLLDPYLSYLYDAATGHSLVDMICDFSPQTRSANVIQIRNTFKNTILNVRYLRSMGVLYEDGSYVAYEKSDRFSTLWQERYREKRRQIYGAALTSAAPVSFSSQEDGVVYVAVPAVSVSHTRSETVGCVVAAYDLSFLQKSFQEADSNSTRNFLTDQQGNILSCARDTFFGQNIEAIAGESANIISMQHSVNTLGWTLHMLVDSDVLLADLTGATNSITVLYLAAALSLVALSLLATYWTLAPTRKMAAAMEEAGKGNLKVRVNVEGSHELWQMAAGFNRMMDRLDGYYETNMRYYQRLLEVQRRKNQAEMAMLESHINAHFLFNTLNAINYQALEAGNRQVSVSIKRLANIMRYAFNSRMKNVRLYQEAAWVEQYLQMQKERMGECMNYDVSIDDDVADWPFRKMILQPFVENAIIHGINGCTDSVILVTAHRRDDGRLCVAISDNGRGMTMEACERVRRVLRSPAEPRGGGIGLSNVAERIYAFFGPESEILLQTAPHEGACFTLLLPMPGDEELEYGYLEEDEEEDDEIL